MNKKANTLLFVLCATIFNIVVSVLTIIILMFPYVRFLMPLLPESGNPWILLLIFVAAIAASFVVYRLAINYLIKKVELEKYFDPIFSHKGHRVSQRTQRNGK